MDDTNGFDQKRVTGNGQIGPKHDDTQTPATPRGTANQVLRQGPAPGGWHA
jgi:hypothetical protein